MICRNQLEQRFAQFMLRSAQGFRLLININDIQHHYPYKCMCNIKTVTQPRNGVEANIPLQNRRIIQCCEPVSHPQLGTLPPSMFSATCSKRRRVVCVTKLDMLSHSVRLATPQHNSGKHGIRRTCLHTRNARWRVPQHCRGIVGPTA